MIRLTLRTLLAYIDDTLEPDEARVLGAKVADSEEAQKIIERIRQATRRRALGAPVAAGSDEDGSNPNVVAEYLSDNLNPDLVGELEEKCLDSDLHLAEVAACHQILTVILTDPVRVPPTANQRMYMLVQAPASDHSRKPGKTTPIGGVLPTAPEQPHADDPDAALLLGMKRYADSDSWSGRVGLIGAVVAVAAALLVAVFFSLPHGDSKAPETSPPTVLASATLPAPIVPKPPEPKKVDTPEPKKVDPPETKKETAPDPKKIDMPDPKKVDMPDPKKDGPKPEDLAPLPGNEELGKMETANVLVLTRAPEATAKWTRVDPAGKNAIRANDTVVALPGFKADVRLATGVIVHLWGNVPDQVLVKPPVLETRVRFHPLAGGLDADLSLDAGRIYITAAKPKAKIRLRIGTEVWDVQLRDEKSEILVQSNTAFVPGTPYARTGGEKPKTEGRVVVIRGGAEFQAPARFKKFDVVSQWSEILWDSKSGQLSDPHPAPKDELYTSKIPNIEGDLGKSLQRVLSDAQRGLTNPEGIRVLLKERLVADPPEKTREVVFATQWATYAQAAITDGADASDLLKDILDPLKADSRSYARQASIISLSNWVARSPDNTDLLVKGILDKGWEEDVPNILAALIRGYAAADMKDKGAALSGLDKLLEWLDDPRLAIREAALGNLLANYWAPDGTNKALFTDPTARVAAPKAWENCLKAWKEYAEIVRQRIADKK